MRSTSEGNMRSSSEDGKSQVQDWLRGFKRGESSNDPRSATSVDNQDKTDDEYEEAREENEYYLPKRPTELEDMAEDHDGCDQKTDLNKASHPKIQDKDLKPQQVTTGSRHTGDDRRDEHSRSGRIVESGQGPTPPQESPRKSHRGDRRDEQRPVDRIGSKPEEDDGPRTVKERPAIGRETASKHPSPPRNMPGTTAATPFVAPAHPYKGEKKKEQSPPRCCCIVL